MEFKTMLRIFYALMLVIAIIMVIAAKNVENKTTKDNLTKAFIAFLVVGCIGAGGDLMMYALKHQDDKM